MNPTPPTWLKIHEDGRAILYLDNFLLSGFNDCEEKFRNAHVLNKGLKGTVGGSAKMNFGIWWGQTLEYFYTGMMDYQKKKEGSKEPSNLTLASAAAQAWHDSKMEISEKWPGESYQEKFPRYFERFGGVDGILGMINSYWNTFGEHDVRNWTIVSAELSFGYGNEVLLYEDGAILVYWCGRPDLVVYENPTDNLLTVDHKSTQFIKSDFINKWKPHPQTAGYVHALQILCKSLGYDRIVSRCMINGAGHMTAIKVPKDGPKPRFLRPRVHYSPEEISEWVYQTALKAKRLWHAYVLDEWVWRESACHLYDGCFFRGLCNVPPATRPIVLKTDYVDIKPWRPGLKLDEEGDEEI